MKIAFDMQPVLHSNKSGVGYNEHGLIMEMMKRHPEHRYLLEYFAWNNAAQKAAVIEEYENTSSEKSVCRWFPGSAYRFLSALIWLPYQIFFSKKRDLTHYFNYFIPPGVQGKKIVTIHDMAFKVYPETVRKKTAVFLKLGLKKSIRRADHIITDSEFSKAEIQRFFSVAPEKITVVPCGVDTEYFHSNYDDRLKKQVRDKYHIYSEQYLLFLGNVEPRKNLQRLVRAYRGYIDKLLAQRPEAPIPPLVIAGGKGWLYDEIFEEVQQSAYEKQYIFTGYIEEEDLPILMAGAALFCFPSLYEGFGMPPLEAMACGTPVLTSDGSSLAEVVGDAAYTVNPLDEQQIADGIWDMMESEELRRQYQRKGIERAKKFSWEEAAEKLYQVYQKVGLEESY